MSKNNAAQNIPGSPPKTKTFASRHVLVAYAVCWSITTATMLSSIFMFAASLTSIEKMTEHIVLCVVTFVLLHIPLVLHKRYHYHIPSFIQISVAILIFAHFVLGEVFRFYDHVILFDKTLHLTNGLVIAACGFSVVYGFSKTDDGPIKLSPFFAALFSFCFAITLLTLWEMLEYMLDSLWGFNMQRYKDGITEVFDENGKLQYLVTKTKRGTGLIDTMHDLTIGAIGAVVVSIIGWMKIKRDSDYTKFLIVRKKPEVSKE
jgi:hypothetical protein